MPSHSRNHPCTSPQVFTAHAFKDPAPCANIRPPILRAAIFAYVGNHTCCGPKVPEISQVNHIALGLLAGLSHILQSRLCFVTSKLYPRKCHPVHCRLWMDPLSVDSTFSRKSCFHNYASTAFLFRRNTYLRDTDSFGTLELLE